MRKLVREQRRLARKEKESNNRKKQRVKVALVHEKITNQRNDFLQKESTMLIRENQTICIEDLKVKNMMHNHRLAKSISSVSWSKFLICLNIKPCGMSMTSSGYLPCIRVPRLVPVVDIKIRW